MEILSSDFEPAPSLCPHTGQCGGCPWQSLPYERQIMWKERLALDAMLRIGGFKEAELSGIWRKPAPSPSLGDFRDKLELAFGPDASGAPALGFRKRLSHEIIPVDQCVLGDGAAMSIAAHMRKLIRKNPWPDFWRFLVLRRGRTLADPAFKWRAILITSPGNAQKNTFVKKLARELLDGQPALAAFIHEERKSREPVAAGQKRRLVLNMSGVEDPEAANMELPLGGRLFQLDAASFFQMNRGAAESLAAIVRQMDEPGGALLDLYCGVGAPGLLLAQNHERILGIEKDRRAAAFARLNAERQGPGDFHYEAGEAARFLSTMRRGAYAAALLDPPRQGLDRAALESLLKIAPRNIIYISCHMAALARDAGILAGKYRLAGMASVDLFPHTPHLECLARFTAL